jgi:hypothetical protein
MAFSFNGTNQRLTPPLPPATISPLTIVCWFNASNNTTTGALITLTNSANSTNYFTIYASGAVVGDPVQLLTQGTGGNQIVSTTAGYASNSWSHACAVFESNTSRTVFLNGANSALGSVPISPQGINEFNIGSFKVTAGNWFSGLIAEVGIWNAALTAAEIASLAKGMTCDKVRPQSLVFYAPLVRDLIDQKGGFAITNNNGATVANHPRIYP